MKPRTTGLNPMTPQDRVSQWAPWKGRTGAQLLSESAWATLCAERPRFVLGVLGYAGRWERTGLRGTALHAFVAAARAALRDQLLVLQAQHGPQLAMASGATNRGVLELAYELCAELGITALGVAPEQVLNYPLAPMDYLLPVGRRFGDESATFVRISDALLLLGGGGQSRREIRMGAAAGKPLTIVQGFGGAADQFIAAELPAARFVRVTQVWS